MRKLLLIDGSNIMFRAYYATAYSGNLMQNSKGEYTNAVFGLANMLNAIINESFTHVVVAFDKGKETFRHKEYEAYKAKRKAMPDEFRMQLDWIRELIDHLGFLQYEDEALEADDIIGSLTTQYYDDFDEIEIISNDRDLFQLLNNKVTLRLSKRGVQPEMRYTKKHLNDELNITPSQIPDLKGLMGDSSDNLPGVPGVGEKTALKLLQEYGSIETLLANQHELKGKLKERIQNHEKEAVLCKRLATIITDERLPIELHQMEYTGINQEALIDFYQRMEFHSLIKRLDTKKPSQKVIKAIEMIDDHEALPNSYPKESILLLERFGDNYHLAEPLGFFVYSEDNAFYVKYQTALKSSTFVAYLTSTEHLKMTFDVKAMMVQLFKENIHLQGVQFDLLLAAYVLNPLNTKEDFKVVVQNFDYHDIPYHEEVYGKGAKQAIPTDQSIANYAYKKALAIKALEQTLKEKLKNQDQERLFYAIEMPLAKTLAKMEFRGIRVDRDALEQLDEDLGREIDLVSEKIHQHAGTQFNISSPKQLGEILFEKLALPSYKKSKTGYSTNVDVLHKLQGKHPIIEDILRYRTLTKLQSTYVKGLVSAMHDDGKIHTIYKQAFTQTGRLSSVEPNLQNIPIRTEMGRLIRKVFVPEENDRLIASDYSQIELRVLAHMADEDTLINAFNHHQDIHTMTAQEIFEKASITANERRIAKAVNFGIIYGQSAWGLSEEIGIGQKEAEAFIDRYYKKFSKIAAFMDAIIDQARDHGYVQTLLKRRRYIPEIHSKIYAQRELGKRTAMNAPIQGSAADIIKIAMVEIDRKLVEGKFDSTLILQIHDELVFNVKKHEEKAVQKLIQEVMEQALKLNVPLTVSISSGENLDDAK